MPHIRKDIKELIKSIFPDNVIEMTIHPDESYFRDIYPNLKAKLLRITGTGVDITVKDVFFFRYL